MDIIKFITDNKKQILITVFVGIFVIYLRPLLDIIGEKVVGLLLKASERFSNQYYLNLSVFSSDKFDRFTYLLLILVVIILLISLLITITSREKEQIKHLPVSFFKMTLWIIFGSAMLTFLLMGQHIYFESQYIRYNAFQNKITAIAPYIANQEVLSYRSRFVLMKNTEDYEQLMDDLNKNIEEFNLDI